GGPARTIAAAPGGWPRGSWGPNGILFSLTSNSAPGQETAGIHLVSADGERTSKMLPGTVFNPKWLPDGKHYLAVDYATAPAPIVARSTDGGSPPVVVHELDQLSSSSGSAAGFDYSTAGFLVF